MVAKRSRWPGPDVRRLPADLQSSDGEVRGDAVRGLCPCHAGWEVFEEHVGDVLRALKDGDRGVRAHALHVFEDAARMQASEDLKYQPKVAEGRLGEKRAGARFRSMEERLEALADSRARKRKGRRGPRPAAR